MTREEAIKRIKARFDKLALDDKDTKAIQTLIPELCENEDERIRKDIIALVKFALKNGSAVSPGSRTTKEEALAYLEKQKEEKPVSYTPLCNTIKGKIREYVANHFVTDTMVNTDVKSIVKAMEEGVRLGKESQKPVEWSEEDKKVYTFIYNFFENSWWDVTWDISREQVLKMLKSLRPQIIDSTPLYTIEQVDEKVREAQEWSEEDEEMKKLTIDWLSLFHRRSNNEAKKYIHECIDWLKSLRPACKPGEEQPEVDLEKEIERYTEETIHLPITHKRTPMDIMESDWVRCAHHFYELGLKAKEE